MKVSSGFKSVLFTLFILAGVALWQFTLESGRASKKNEAEVAQLELNAWRIQALDARSKLKEVREQTIAMDAALRRARLREFYGVE